MANETIDSHKLYSEIIANVNLPYALLSIKRAADAPEILQIEFLKGSLGDVVRPKPIIIEIEFPDKVVKVVEEDMREILQTMAKSIIGQDVVPLSKIVQRVGQVIYSLFPDAIKESLQEMSNGSLLTLALEDCFLGLPWELAYNGSDFLCVQFGVGRVIFSENPVPNRRQPKKETRVLLISNPDNSLPETRENVALPLKKKLENLGVTVDHMCYSPLSLHHTSKKNVMDAFASGLYDVIHFIGHGSYDPRFPEESAFRLADNERLSAKEISEVLDSAIMSGKDPPSLFYAHSCEAGFQPSWDMRTYESQVLGISEAFVRHNIAYIGGFWSTVVPVADKLALAFYDELLDRKEPIGLALTKARLTILKEMGPDYPNCEWANFMLYGDPSLTIRI